VSPCFFTQEPDQLVIQIDYRHAFFIQGREQFAFCLGHALKRTQAFQMRRTDVGDQSYVRLGNFRQAGDFARVVHAHFQDHEALIRAQAQKRQRQANLVVQIARRGQGRRAGRKRGRCQFFSTCFTGRTGNSQYLGAKAQPLPPGGQGQRPPGVIHGQQRQRQAGGLKVAAYRLHPIARDDRRRRARPRGWNHEIMAVEVRAAQGDEQLPRADGPAVGGHAGKKKLAGPLADR